MIRKLPRDWPIFERMLPGDEYPAAHDIAEMLFREQLQARRQAGDAVGKEPGPRRISAATSSRLTR